jgi:hypothetical protein
MGCEKRIDPAPPEKEKGEVILAKDIKDKRIIFNQLLQKAKRRHNR